MSFSLGRLLQKMNNMCINFLVGHCPVQKKPTIKQFTNMIKQVLIRA